MRQGNGSLGQRSENSGQRSGVESKERPSDYPAGKWFYFWIWHLIRAEVSDHDIFVAIDVEQLTGPSAFHELAFVADHVPFVNFRQHSALVSFFAASTENPVHDRVRDYFLLAGRRSLGECQTETRDIAQSRRHASVRRRVTP